MIWTGFIVGLVGSLHCVGMCGPIAMALPIAQNKNRYVGIFLYNVGRILTYGTIGLLFGSIGSLTVLAGYQQALSIGSGVLMLLFLILPLVGKKEYVLVGSFTRLTNWLKSNLGKLFKKSSYSALMLTGLLNGLLPCGMVYAAILGSLAMANTLGGALYMMLFGLGTLPLMFAVAVSKSFVSTQWRIRFVKVVPYYIALVGILLILRGMNLGIPYVSPEMSQQTGITAGGSAKLKCH